jgi:hypothetical protein
MTMRARKLRRRPRPRGRLDVDAFVPPEVDLRLPLGKHRVLANPPLCCSRQSGKSAAVSLLALHVARRKK